MRLLHRLRLVVRGLVAPRRVDRDLTDELADWTEELAARHRAAGLTAGEAWRRAQLEVGSTVAKQTVLDDRPLLSLRRLPDDFRDAWRLLRRAPAFTTAIVLTLALGIGASTAIFSVVHAMLLAPLPYRDSSRLVFIWADMTSGGYPRAPLSGPELADLRERTTRFEGFGSIWATSLTLTDGEPEQLRTGLVTANFFSLLGVEAALGRTFGPEDEAPPGGGILLSWALFERRFGGDATVVGRRIQVNGQPQTVLGVLPATFRLLLPVDAAVPDELQAWTLLRAANLARSPRGQQFLRVVGRLKPGVSLADGRADVNAVATAISRQFTEYGTTGRDLRTVGLQADDVREIRSSLLVLFAGVGLLGLIACVNVASLLVARAADRTRETALRAALGASRARLLGHCLAEAVLLSILGTLAGLIVARVGLGALLAMRPTSLDRLAAARLDPAVILFACTAALLGACLFSLGPVLEVVRTNLTTALKAGDRRTVAGVPHRRARQVLVFVQIALGVVLLVGAGLLVRTVVAMERADLGYRSDHLLTFRLPIPFQRYRTPAAINDVSRRIETALAAVPGVTGVGAVSHLPFDNTPNWGGAYLSRPGADEATAADADYRTVTPGFFEETGVHLLSGRFFTEADDAGSQPVAIVDDLLASRAWPNASALGQRVVADPGSSGHPTAAFTVVGIVGHLRIRSVVANLTEQIYFPERQVLRNPMAYAVRTDTDPTRLTPDIRRALATIDPRIPLADVRPFDSFTREATAGGRFTAMLAAVFAVAALVLACVGIYGVVAYGVARRTGEFAVRLVLGARPGQVVSLALGEGVRLAVVGALAGLVAAAGAAEAIRAQLFGVTPIDPATFIGAAAALIIACLASSWLPARRAARAVPAQALRGE
jgi:putative ABC transport system permease protein